MPYTPPTQRSPTPTGPSTPPHQTPALVIQTATPAVTRDAPSGAAPSHSYIHKHRRSPSLTQSAASLAPPSAISATISPKHNKPASGREMGAQLSSPSSSDEDSTQERGRVRELAKLSELKAAIRDIEQRRESSPAGTDEGRAKFAGVPSAPILTTTNAGQVPVLQAAAEIRIRSGETSPCLDPSSQSQRSHARSSTDTGASLLDFAQHRRASATSLSSGSSDADDEETASDTKNRIKPALLRKKSGELVRPALRAPSTRRRPISMPGTPTYAKAVHFQDNSLEHVRHFLQVDRPIAVSAGTSPVEDLDDDAEFPFGGDDRAQPLAYAWEIRVPNFPADRVDRAMLPVRTERVYLSPDTRTLLGTVAVRNLSFHKSVVARFTLDYWKTTSEVKAEYHPEVRNRTLPDGYDRFTFSIRLDDQANLANKTMFFCVRYNVTGQEYWDNNNSLNYQVDFSKRFNPAGPRNESGSTGSSATNNNNARSGPPSQQRPRSVPSFDDFGSHWPPFDFKSTPQPTAMIGEAPIRFRNRAAATAILPDAPAAKAKTGGSQQAFGNRYDFGASLSAAIQASSGNSPRSTQTAAVPQSYSAASSKTADPSSSVMTSTAIPVRTKAATITGPAPAALTTQKPALQSPSYHELLDRYCFFGSAKPSTAGSAGIGGSLDGANDASASSSTYTPSPVVSPPRARSPPAAAAIQTTTPPKPSSQRVSRATSPGNGPNSSMSSRNQSPGYGLPSYHHQHHQGIPNGFFEAHTPTAIRG